ncbi:hypothetical protein COF68_05980 [Bacillus toyonensis]|uniref:hypothetical protein n=1 Tax=Bacillus toyonensis TaxID=155322 RepID=UPI000BFBAECE|nr:hypothetical protein [Bacillus toyonensis]PHE64384.1 hypothetical protein COF68_05980 [Bacillus toyonensis]
MSKTHRCYNGKVFTDSTRTAMMPCPDCQREKKNEVRDGMVNPETGKTESLASILGLNKKFVTDMYSDENIIGSADKYYIDHSSLIEFNAVVEAVTSNLTMGNLPDTSLIMYAGRHAKLHELAYCFQASAHKGLMKVGRALTPRDIIVNKYKEDFSEFYEHDLAIVIMTDDADSIAFSEVQGFMQNRSYNNNPTIVLLSNRRNFTLTIGRLCSLDEPRMDLGAFIGVNYKQGLNMSEETIVIAQKAFKVSNEILGTNQKLEDTMKVPNENLRSTDAEMQSFELDKFTTGKSNFGGRRE